MARRSKKFTIGQEVTRDVYNQTGKETSEIGSDSLRETARVESFRRGLEWFNKERDDIFMPGYREEFWLERGNPEMAQAVREEEAAKRR